MRSLDAHPPQLLYKPCQPNRWTFESTVIREWVEGWLHGRVLNACAGKTKLNHGFAVTGVVRNDIDPERDADTHYDVCDISRHFELGSFDTIVYDPPFSENQAETVYSGHNIQDEARAKREFHQLLRPGGIIIQFGFSSTNMPASLGYVRREVCLFNTLGRSNDWIGTVDQRVNESL